MVFVSCLSMAVLMHKDSARRAQWQKTACRFFCIAEPPVISKDSAR